MSFTPISLFFGKKDDYIQVVVFQERYLERLFGLGWTKLPEDLKDDDAPAQPTGSADDIELKIMGFESKDEVESLIKELFNVDIDKRGSLDHVKDKALQIARAPKPE